MSEARLKAIYATLLSAGVSDERLALLTDWQIKELYWHKRNRKGEIEIPGWEPALRAKAGPTTLEDELKVIESVAAMLGGLMAPGEAERAKEALRARYAAQAAGGGNGAVEG